MFQLRPYQIEKKRALYRAIKTGARSILACGATGTGKTEEAGSIIADLLSRGGWSLFVVDRLELCEQTACRFADRYGFPSAVCQGSHPLSDPTAPIQVGTWQTLTRRREWLLNWIASAPGSVLVWWDEAHETMWTGFSMWLRDATKDNPRVVHIGLTATPDRLKRSEGMGDVCDALVSGLTPGQAMDQGYLVRDRYIDVPLTGVDLSALRLKMGDYEEEQLADAMAHPATIKAAVNAWLEHARDRSTIAFAVNVRHAQALDAAFRAAGITSAVVHGETPPADRKEIMEALDSGRVQVLCNCMIAIKGLDVTRISCILFSRPTKSLALWFQAIGRGLRLHDGKIDCIILDQGECVKTHGRARDYPPFKLKKGIPPGQADPDEEEADGGGGPAWACQHCRFEPNPASQNACKSCGERRITAKGRDFVIEYPDGDYLAPVGALIHNIPCRLNWIKDPDAVSPFFFANFKHPADGKWRAVCGQLPQVRPPDLKPGTWIRVSGRAKEHRPPYGDKPGATRLTQIAVELDQRFLTTPTIP